MDKIIKELTAESLSGIEKQLGICAICKEFTGTLLNENNLEISLPVGDYSCKAGMLVLKGKVGCAKKNFYTA